MKLQVRRFGKDSTNINKKSNYWKEFFEKRASNYNLKESYKVNGFVDNKLVKVIRHSVRKIIINNKFNLLFDCGCGDGFVTAPLISEKRTIIGIDFSEAMCKRAAKKGLKTFKKDLIQLSNSKLASLINSNSSIKNSNTCILFCESLGHIENPLKIIDSFCNNNQDIKNILISVPNEKSIIRKLVNSLHKNEVNYFSLNRIKKTVSKNNFYISDLDYIIGIPFLFSFKYKLQLKKNIFYNLQRTIVSFFGLNLVVLFKKI